MTLLNWLWPTTMTKASGYPGDNRSRAETSTAWAVTKRSHVRLLHITKMNRMKVKGKKNRNGRKRERERAGPQSQRVRGELVNNNGGVVVRVRCGSRRCPPTLHDVARRSLLFFSLLFKRAAKWRLRFFLTSFSPFQVLGGLK